MDKFEEQLMRYENGQMNPAEAAEFETLLAQIDTDLENSDWREICENLRIYRNAAPSEELLKSFQSAMAMEFPANRTFSLQATLRGIWERVFIAPTPAFRLAEFAVVLLIGIFAGQWLLSPQPVFTPSPEAVYAPSFQLRDVSSKEWQDLKMFLLDSEMLLLEIDNIADNETPDSEFLDMNAQTSKRLMRQMPMAEQVSVRMNDLLLVRYLSRLEMLLYEISNIEPDEADTALQMLKSMIRDSDLLIEARQLQIALRQNSAEVQSL